MKDFLGEDFLLNTETAKKLYFDAAKDMPIFDFHNHLDAKEIYEDKQYNTITEAWLGEDHYKWRAMRTYGYTHEQITGDETSDFEKFKMWATTIENLFGNPLYHWTHLELQRYFDIYEPLNSDNAKEIYDKCNEMLQDDNFSVRNLLRRMNIYELCTTNTPDEDLKYHRLIYQDNDIDFKVTPTFRTDNNLDYCNSQEELDSKLKFLNERLDYFIDNGCKITDHSIEVAPFSENYQQYLLELGKMYKKNNLVQQYHIGALRNNSTRLFESYGADIGCDSIHDINFAKSLSGILDALDKTNDLTKTVIYNLNPKDNEVIITLAGCFQQGPIRGKIQYGSAWWFLDNINGMIRQLDSVANNGMLSTSIGMLTDSRSFLSFPRHEYYRRILCNYIGEKVDNGEFPNDIKYLSKMVKDICFYNAKNYLEN